MRSASSIGRVPSVCFYSHSRKNSGPKVRPAAQDSNKRSKDQARHVWSADHVLLVTCVSRWHYEMGKLMCRRKRRKVDGAVMMVGTRVSHRMKGTVEMKG